MYPIEKYHFTMTTSEDGRPKIVAETTYAGKPVRGVAICHPTDEYDEEKGKNLAAARCALKVAKKRSNRAAKKVYEALYKIRMSEDYYDKMTGYRLDSNDALTKAEDHLNAILNKML